MVFRNESQLGQYILNTYPPMHPGHSATSPVMMKKWLGGFQLCPTPAGSGDVKLGPLWSCRPTVDPCINA